MTQFVTDIYQANERYSFSGKIISQDDRKIIVLTDRENLNYLKKLMSKYREVLSVTTTIIEQNITFNGQLIIENCNDNFLTLTINNLIPHPSIS